MTLMFLFTGDADFATLTGDQITGTDDDNTVLSKELYSFDI